MNGVCVLRYDNEAGKGDHRHIGSEETPYTLTTIEQLLAIPILQQAVPVQGVVLPAQSAASAPSIWPCITAAGLLLTFIGLLGLLAFTIVGLCVVVVSLLWWTIGTGTRKEPAAPIPVGVGRS